MGKRRDTELTERERETLSLLLSFNGPGTQEFQPYNFTHRPIAELAGTGISPYDECVFNDEKALCRLNTPELNRANGWFQTQEIVSLYQKKLEAKFNVSTLTRLTTEGWLEHQRQRYQRRDRGRLTKETGRPVYRLKPTAQIWRYFANHYAQRQALNEFLLSTYSKQNPHGQQLLKEFMEAIRQLDPGTEEQVRRYTAGVTAHGLSGEEELASVLPELFATFLIRREEFLNDMRSLFDCVRNLGLSRGSTTLMLLSAHFFTSAYNPQSGFSPGKAQLWALTGASFRRLEIDRTLIEVQKWLREKPRLRTTLEKFENKFLKPEINRAKALEQHLKGLKEKDLRPGDVVPVRELISPSQSTKKDGGTE